MGGQVCVLFKERGLHGCYWLGQIRAVGIVFDPCSRLCRRSTKIDTAVSILLFTSSLLLEFYLRSLVSNTLLKTKHGRLYNSCSAFPLAP